MLAVSWDTIRLFLHVLAATIWVGGQLTLAALVPVLRRFGADALGASARRFNQTVGSVLPVPGGYLGGRPRPGRTGGMGATGCRRGPDHMAGTA
jgi:uncharacterized membrane protein